jgi:hypothetical protein
MPPARAQRPHREVDQPSLEDQHEERQGQDRSRQREDRAHQPPHATHPVLRQDSRSNELTRHNFGLAVPVSANVGDDGIPG